MAKTKSLPEAPLQSRVELENQLENFIAATERQKADLMRQLEEIKAVAKAEAIDHVNELLAEHGILSGELKFPSSDRKPAGKSKYKVKRGGKDKYRNDQTGDHWSGYGQAPKWIKDHESTGGSREDFRIKEV